MQEPAVADEAVFGTVAVEQTVDFAEVEIAGGHWLRHVGEACLTKCLFDPVGGARVGRHDVEGVGRPRIAGDLRLQPAVLEKDIEKIGHGAGVVSGAGQVFHAQDVGLIFLIARVGTHPELGDAAAERGGLFAQQPAQPYGGKLADDTGAHAIEAVAGVHMADLMRQDAGELCLVLCQREQTARDVDIAAGQGEGVDHRRVQHGEGIVEVGLFGGAGQELPERVDVGLNLRVFVGPAEVLDQLIMLLRAQASLETRQPVGRSRAGPGEADRQKGGRRRTGREMTKRLTDHGSSSSSI